LGFSGFFSNEGVSSILLSGSLVVIDLAESELLIRFKWPEAEDFGRGLDG